MVIKKQLSLLFIMISAVIFLQSCSNTNEKNVSELKKVNGIIYDKVTKKPFSGTAIAYYGKTPKSKKSETPCKNGLINGTETIWYKNGNKKARKNYLNGKLHGESFFWYTKGQRKAIETYKKGKLAGRQRSWKKNGAVIKDKIIH